MATQPRQMAILVPLAVLFGLLGSFLWFPSMRYSVGCNVRVVAHKLSGAETEDSYGVLTRRCMRDMHKSFQMASQVAPRVTSNRFVTFAEDDPEIPHMAGCMFCQECKLVDGRTLKARDPVVLRDPDFVASVANSRTAYPNCTVCEGCTHVLRPLDLRIEFNNNTIVAPYTGASRAWTVLTESQRAENGRAVAKLICVDMEVKGGWAKKPCSPYVSDDKDAMLLAFDTLKHDLGLDHLVLGLWTEELKSLLLPTGYVYSGVAKMTDVARGVPLTLLVESMRRLGQLDVLLDFMQLVDPADIVQAAVMDFLTSQCDRHPNNIFLDESGRITLIDNDQMLGESWRACGFDSMFVPGSEKYDINSFGFPYVVLKRETPISTSVPNVLLHFDYRCHVPGGKVGTNFPAGMADTIQWLGVATPSDIEQKYGFPLKYATMLQLRASSLVSLGFEEAIKSGKPLNPPVLRHDALEPCCNIVATAGASFCGDRYEPVLYNNTRLPWREPPPDARPGRAPTPAMQARMRRLMSYHDPVTGGWTREDLQF